MEHLHSLLQFRRHQELHQQAQAHHLLAYLLVYPLYPDLDFLRYQSLQLQLRYPPARLQPEYFLLLHQGLLYQQPLRKLRQSHRLPGYLSVESPNHL